MGGAFAPAVGAIGRLGLGWEDMIGLGGASSLRQPTSVGFAAETTAGRRDVPWYPRE